MFLNLGDEVRERGGGRWASAWRVENFLASGRHARLYTVRNMRPELSELRAVLKLVKYDPRRCDQLDYIRLCRARLERERETLAHFSPRLPEPLDAFMLDNTQDPFEGFGAEALRAEEPVVVLSLLHGSTLADMMRERGAPPAPAETLLLTLAKVCSFLDELHASGRGWLFWGLTPEHVVVHPDHDYEPAFVGCGNFRMLRGGLAVRDPADQDPRLGALPEPGYAAPEALSVSACDHRVDLYAMGAMLFHLFTGTDPRDLADDLLARGTFTPQVHAGAQGAALEFQAAPTMSVGQAQRFCMELRSSMERFCRRNLKGLGIHRARVRKIILKAVEPDPDARFSGPLELRDALLQTLTRSRRVAWPGA